MIKSSLAVTNLNFEKFCAEELPLPGARQEDPDAVVAVLPLQRAPLLKQVVLQRLTVFRFTIPDREESVEVLGDNVFRVAWDGVLVRIRARASSEMNLKQCVRNMNMVK